MKAVLFATGPLDIAAAEARALRARLGSEAVTVVAALGEVAANRGSLIVPPQARPRLRA